MADWETHVLCVAAEIEPPRPQGVTVAHMPLADDDPAEDITRVFEGATAFVRGALDEGGRVLMKKNDYVIFLRPNPLQEWRFESCMSNHSDAGSDL